MPSEEAPVNFYSIISLAETPQIWSMSPAARLEKQCRKLGMSPANDQTPQNENVLILRGDVVYDASILKNIQKMPDTAMAADEPLAACVRFEQLENTAKWFRGLSETPGGLTLKTPEDIGDNYNHILRKREAPLCEKLTSDNKDAIEWRLFMASYKGVTDLVTKYWWPVPAFHVTKLCAKLQLTPNMVTTIGAVLMFAALWAFWEGHYGWGLLAGWVMTFLDTVDGKLARVTITSSKWGNIFDHGLDLLHPPFWYIAWGIGLSAYGTPLPEGWLEPMLYTMFAFYVLGRFAEGYFIMRFKMHIHVWRRFDSFFRLILARRNPNMIFMTVLWAFGRPDIALILIVAWHVITFIVHCVQSLQAELHKAQGRAITSWLEASA